LLLVGGIFLLTFLLRAVASQIRGAGGVRVDMVRPEMINSRVSARARSPITGTSKEMHAASFAWTKDQLDEWGMPTEG
jgi:hypothetical protein